MRERKVCTLTNQSSSGLHHHGTLVGMRHHGTRVVFAFVLCAIAAHSSSLPFIVCAITAHSSSVFASSAPARHTRRLCLRRLRHHGTLLLGVCTITAHLSGPSTMLFLKLLPIVSAPSRHIDLLCAITAHLTLPFRRHSSPLSGPNTMLLLNLLLIVPAPSRHIPSSGLSSAPSRHIFVVVCAVMAQLSSAILCPSLPAGP